jgi:hypothetical protein
MCITSNVRATPPLAPAIRSFPCFSPHLSPATHQHADARAIDGGETRNINHQTAAALVDELQDGVLDLGQRVTESQSARDIDNIDISLFARAGFGDHG